jgi:hypothetical protein
MRLAALGFLAALLAGPLGAQAAQAPARFSVTLQGTIVDRLTYERTTVDEECTSHRTGDGGRLVSIQSFRPTAVEVTRGSAGIVYRPSRIAALQVGATRLAGSFTELRRCRFLPPERVRGSCPRAGISIRLMRADFRSRPNAIAFRRPRSSRSDVTSCGLSQSFPGGWLHLAAGRIDSDALLGGRSRRVIVRASGTRETILAADPTLQATERTTVRWTLTFRRLS